MGIPQWCSKEIPEAHKHPAVWAYQTAQTKVGWYTWKNQRIGVEGKSYVTENNVFSMCFHVGHCFFPMCFHCFSHEDMGDAGFNSPWDQSTRFRYTGNSIVFQKGWMAGNGWRWGEWLTQVQWWVLSLWLGKSMEGISRCFIRYHKDNHENNESVEWLFTGNLIMGKQFRKKNGFFLPESNPAISILQATEQTQLHWDWLDESPSGY